MVYRTFFDILKCLNPVCSIDGNILLQQAVEDALDITDKRDRRSEVFADLGGIDIDVDDIYLLFQIFRLRNGAVSDPRTGNDQKVTVCNGAVRVRFSVISKHSEVKRVVLRHNADAHHRCYKRNIVLLTELADTFLTVSEDHAAAGEDHGAFRFLNQIQCLDDIRDCPFFKSIYFTGPFRPVEAI